MEWKKRLRFAAAGMMLVCQLSLSSCYLLLLIPRTSVRIATVAGFLYNIGDYLVVVDDYDRFMTSSYDCPIVGLDGKECSPSALHSGLIVKIEYETLTSTNPEHVYAERIIVTGETEDRMGFWISVSGLLDQEADITSFGRMYLFLHGTDLSGSEQAAVKYVVSDSHIIDEETSPDYNVIHISVTKTQGGRIFFTGGIGHTGGDYLEFQDARAVYSASEWEVTLGDPTQLYLYAGAFFGGLEGGIHLHTPDGAERVITHWEELIHSDGSPATESEISGRRTLLAISGESWPAEPERWGEPVTARTILIWD